MIPMAPPQKHQDLEADPLLVLAEDLSSQVWLEKQGLDMELEAEATAPQELVAITEPTASWSSTHSHKVTHD